MSDLISRQAAIDAICNACGKIDCDEMDKCEKLQLPPANCSEFPNNSDTVSRQAAIDALNDIASELHERGRLDEEYIASWCAEEVEQLLPIQPDNGLQKLADEIESFKRCVKSENSDYLTGYLCALSAVEGMIAERREVTT